MRFGSFMRGDTVNRNPELIELAAKAGLSFVLMGIETLNPAWLKSHGKGVRADDIVSMYTKVYRTLRKNGIFVIGLFITPPDASDDEVSGRGADGVVCDAHYTADLVAQKGSALFVELLKNGAVGKDMFYHDWNLPSIRPRNGRPQTSRKSFRTLLRNWNGVAVRTAFIGPSLARRFRWRNVGVLAERVICTSLADLRRYRIAKDASLPLELRQQNIVDTVITPSFIEKLIKSRSFKSPLALRTGIWSSHPLKKPPHNPEPLTQEVWTATP
jgi:anaerobic magnesium-protoporphyrin IX monomethyl ester cyclase